MNRHFTMLMVMFAVSAQAAPPTFRWWQDAAPGGVAKDGSITLKSSPGASGKSFVTNPTGANLKSTRSANVQPPTVVVQATTGSWKDPVATWAALMALTGNSDGDVRLVQNINKAFAWVAASSTWKPIGQDRNGYVDYSVDPTDLSGAAVPVEGTACSGRKSGMDANGLLLTCQSGRWRKSSGSAPEAVYSSTEFREYAVRVVCRALFGWSDEVAGSTTNRLEGQEPAGNQFSFVITQKKPAGSGYQSINCPS